jgi:hypothetical protein
MIIWEQDFLIYNILEIDIKYIDETGKCFKV